MLNYRAFSATRLGRIFAADVLEAYPFYVELNPRGDFDTEFLGGQWHEELIDGVQLFFPAADGDKLGCVEVWGSGGVASAAVRDKTDASASALVPSWVANADRVLEAFDVPLRLGNDQKAVQALAAGRVVSSDYPVPGVKKGSILSLKFACRAPEVYHVNAFIHASTGLLRLEIRRPDLVRKNDASGVYDACFSTVYDEGTSGNPERKRRGQTRR
jgi:hypothetical protein